LTVPKDADGTTEKKLELVGTLKKVEIKAEKYLKHIDWKRV